MSGYRLMVDRCCVLIGEMGDGARARDRLRDEFPAATDEEIFAALTEANALIDDSAEMAAALEPIFVKAFAKNPRWAERGEDITIKAACESVGYDDPDVQTLTRLMLQSHLKRSTPRGAA